ncbi:transglutaminase superfamily protein [Diaminobutyricimonas aerilata]|uniref:Transglutaminase superfamily protein n=1 Tax=Diaminobutyricimonas aerilata TaxID=1162967 RepID=A0A2M9CLD9_9MICO|nr:transglutaminase-like domain-containing protein [Diaminobutyricimonas aerilata]PJJ72705.1 transglutaminase superfamily protein [Diaminobutyricimonas aerilata]
MRRRPDAVTVLGTVLLFWAAIACAAAALYPIYRDPQFLVVAVGAVLGGTVVAVLGALLRWSSFLVFLAGLLAVLALGVPLAVPRLALRGVLPTLEGLRELVLAIALGWKQLLTIALPVGAYQALLVPAFVLLLVATVVGLSVGLRARFGELGAIAPLTVFVIALALGPDDRELGFWVPVLLVASVLLWVVWRRWARRRASIALLARQGAPGDELETRGSTLAGATRALVAAGVLVALAAGASFAAASALPTTSERDVLRTVVARPFDPRDYVSPLSGFRGYLREDREDAALFDIDGLREGDRVRIATLDSYDGVVYAVGSGDAADASGRFTRVPDRFDQGDLAGDPVELEVRIRDYSGVWLPTVGAFEAIDFAGADAGALSERFYFNPVTDTAAVVDGLRPGDMYRLQAIVPDEPTIEELEGINPGAAVVPDPEVVPEELAERLDQYAAAATTPGAALVDALEGLARDGYISHGQEDEPPSRSGHSADRITQLLTEPLMIGDAEQYAVTAALMARQLGFPARVVFGFAPEEVGSTTTVRGDDVTAWIEIDTAERGWVAVDPNPAVRPIPEAPPEEPTPVSRPQPVVPPPATQPDERDDQVPPESDQEQPEALDPLLALLLTVLAVAGWSLLALAILASPFLAIIGSKVLRARRRRRAADPRDRIRGGWDEFADAALDHGYRPTATATRSEVAETVGGTKSRILAYIADRASFAPGAPPEDDPDRVWRSVDELKQAMDAKLTRWERLRARLSLRSLRRYAGRRPAR